MRRALAALSVLLATACGVPQDDAPHPLDRGAAPFRVFEPSAAPSPEGEVDVQLWFTRGDRLVPVERVVERPGTPEQVLETLFTGVTDAERADGLTNAIPTAITLDSVEVDDRIAVVTLEGLNEQVRVLAFAQIVTTLDGRPEVDGVRFRSDDRDVQVPRGDGSLTGAPVDRGSYTVLLGAAETPAAVPPAPVAPG